MNVYEESHRLSQAIKESEEYKQYMNLKAKIDENPELAKKVNDFIEKQFELQAQQLINKEEANSEKMAQEMANLQELSRILMTDPLAAEYLQAQVRFSIMMNDVYKILSDVISVGNVM